MIIQSYVQEPQHTPIKPHWPENKHFPNIQKTNTDIFQVCYIFCPRIYCTINIYLSPNVNGIKNIFYNFEDDKDLKTSRKEEKHHYNLYFIPLIKTLSYEKTTDADHGRRPVIGNASPNR